MIALELRDGGLQLVYKKDRAISNQLSGNSENVIAGIDPLILFVNISVADGHWHSVEVLIFPSHLTMSVWINFLGIRKWSLNYLLSQQWDYFQHITHYLSCLFFLFQIIIECHLNVGRWANSEIWMGKTRDRPAHGIIGAHVSWGSPPAPCISANSRNFTLLLKFFGILCTIKEICLILCIKYTIKMDEHLIVFKVFSALFSFSVEGKASLLVASVIFTFSNQVSHPVQDQCKDMVLVGSYCRHILFDQIVYGNIPVQARLVLKVQNAEKEDSNNSIASVQICLQEQMEVQGISKTFPQTRMD